MFQNHSTIYGYYTTANESATPSVHTSQPDQNLSTEATWESRHYSDYDTSFRVVLSLVLVMEELGGLICNILVLIMFHLHHKTTPGASVSSNNSAGKG